MIEVQVQRTEQWPDPTYVLRKEVEYILIKRPTKSSDSDHAYYTGNWDITNGNTIPQEVKNFANKLWREKRTIENSEIRVYSGLGKLAQYPAICKLGLYSKALSGLQLFLQHGGPSFISEKDINTKANFEAQDSETISGEGWSKAWEFCQEMSSGKIQVQFENHSYDTISAGALEDRGLDTKNSWWKSIEEIFELSKYFWDKGLDVNIHHNDGGCIMYLCKADKNV